MVKESNSKKKYSVLDNIVFCHKKLKEHMGVRYFVLAPMFILASVIVPLFMVILPSAVIKVLLSDLLIEKMILAVMLLPLLLCIGQFVLNWLHLESFKESFLFRIGLGTEFSAKIISVPYEVAESPQGKERLQKANVAIYRGNNIGVEATVLLTTMLIINVLGLALYSIITANLHPFLMVLLIVCPVSRLLVLNFNRKWTEKHKKDWTPIEVKMDYLQKESLDIKHGKDIRMYQVEKWFVSHFHTLIGKRLYWYKKEVVRFLNAKSVDRVMSLIRDIFCYGYLIYRVTKGMGIAEFTLYLGIIGGFSAWIEKIFDNYSNLLESNMTINDYREFMEQEDYWDIGGNDKIPKKKTHRITLENVSFTYPGNESPIFESLNLTIEKGEKLAIVGMNGSGKSTLIKLICGIYKPQKGRILLDGIDISTFNLREYYSLYSVVFQEIFAFAFPIIDNITCDTEKACDENKLTKCIEMAGLKDKINSLPKGVYSHMLKDLEDDGINLSGGEMQKLMLARALYKDSSMIILDEPTAALDPIAELEMYEKYNSFTKGRTSIFISHRLSSTVFCDRVIFLKEGKIIEDGTHESLMNLKGEYANMYELQAHYYQEEVEDHAC